MFLTIRQIVTKAAETGVYFKRALSDLAGKCPVITEVRGMGLMLGACLSIPATPVVKACMERGFLINAVQDQILRFVPPLIIDKKDIDALIKCLEAVLKEGE